MGWTMLLVGAISTIPLATHVYRHMRSESEDDGKSAGRLRNYAMPAETPE